MDEIFVKLRCGYRRWPLPAIALLSMIGALLLPATVQAAAPTASLTAPANGARVGGAAVTLTCSATGNPKLSSVEFSIDGSVPAGGTVAVSPTASSAVKNYSWDATAAGSGSHTLRCRSYNGSWSGYSSVTVTVDASAPTSVSVLSPTASSYIKGTQNFQATGLDNYGITSFAYKLDGATLSTGTYAEVSPQTQTYSWNTATASDGPHTLTVTASDAATLSTTSAGIGVTVDNTAPSSATITAPASSTGVSGTINVDTAGADAIGAISAKLLVDGTVTSTQTFASTTSTTKTFSLNTDALALGSHTLAVRYEDNAANTTTSGNTTIIVDRAAPTGSITAPANGALISGAAYSWTTSSTDDVGVNKVEWYVDGVLDSQQSFAAVSPATKTYSWDTTTETPGSHVLTAKFYDQHSSHVTTSTSVTVSVDNAGPTSAVLNSPANGANVSGGAVTVEATGEDAIGVVSATLLIDGSTNAVQTFASATSANRVFSWNSAASSAGDHTVAVRFADGAGNTLTTSAVTVHVDQTAPTATIAAPAASSNNSGTKSFTVSSTDDVGTVKIQWLIDAVQVDEQIFAAATSTSKTYSWDTTTATDGAHSLTAKAYDAWGRITTSSAISVNVDNAAPTSASITSTFPNAFYKGTQSITATGTDAAGTTSAVLLVDGATAMTQTYSATPSKTATFSWNSANVAAGAHTLTVKFIDAAGNFLTSAGVAITTDNTAPTVSITDPTNNENIRGNIDITADAADAGSGVSKMEWFVDNSLKSTLNVNPTEPTKTATYTWDSTTLPEGSHTLKVKAYDGLSTVTTSSTITISTAAYIDCSYAANTMTINLINGDTANLAVNGSDAITANTVACGAATQSNTDSVVVNGTAGTETVNINKDSFTNNSHDVTFSINLGGGSSDALKVSTGYESAIFAGRNGGGDNVIGWDRNTGTSLDGAFVTFTGVETVTLAGSSLNDLLLGDPTYGAGGGDIPQAANYPLRIEGNGGGDTMNGGSAADTFVGGTNGLYNVADTVTYRGRSAAVTADLDGVADDGQSGELDTIGADVENITGGNTIDTITGSSANNILRGGGSADALYGGSGNDYLYEDGSTGGVEAPDYLDGGSGNDALIASSTSAAGDQFVGSLGTDSVYITGRAANVSVSLDDVNNDGESGEADNVRSDVENVTTGAGDDTLIGNTLANVLDGGDGADWFSGGAGNDIFTKTGSGTAATPGDVVLGGDGIDTAKIYNTTITDPLTLSLDDVDNDGQAGEGDNIHSDVENMYAAAGNDTLTGNFLANVLTGSDGSDTLTGGTGNDTLAGGVGDDQLLGGDGNDKLDGYSGDDTLTGGAGTDKFLGGNGDDRLYALDAVKESVSGGADTDCASYDTGSVVDKLSLIEQRYSGGVCTNL